MSQQTDAEREALETLLASDGWRYLVAHAQREYGAEQYRRRVQVALQAPSMQGHAEVLKVEASAEAVGMLLRWPQERVEALRRTPDKVSRFPGGAA